MTFTRFLHRSLHLWLALAAAGPALAQTSPDAATLGRVERLAARLANELAEQCPVAGPGDQAAFDACRQGLYQDSTLRRNLSEHVLWGRKRDFYRIKRLGKGTIGLDCKDACSKKDRKTH